MTDKPAPEWDYVGPDMRTAQPTPGAGEGKRWEKVGAEEIKGPTGNVKMAQIYVPNQGFGQNLYGPEWLIDEVMKLHNARVADQQTIADLRAELANAYRELHEISDFVATTDDTIAELRKALEKIGRCTRCGGDGSPQCVTCDDYQFCHCKPGHGRYADKCWACEGTGISNKTAREALAAIAATEEK